MNVKNLILNILIISIFYLSTCSHTKSISNYTNDKKYIPKIGDDVKVLTIDSSEYKFFITEITTDSLKSKNYKFSLNEIQSIEKIENNLLRFLSIFAGIVIINGVLVLLYGISVNI